MELTKICIDTSVLIHYYRSTPKTGTFFFQLASQHQICIPSVVVYEILRGDKQKDEFWNNVFHAPNVEILNFDADTAAIAANIYQQLQQKKALPGKPETFIDDILIAATALQHNLTLATSNKKDFEAI